MWKVPGNEGSWREWAARLWHRDRPMVIRLLAVGALGLALIVAGTWPRTPAHGRAPAAVAAAQGAAGATAILQEERALDQQVAVMVKAIPGAGHVSAGVTLSRTALTTYAGKPPRAVSESEPTVSGVVVVATGADNPAIRQEITMAVETLLQVEAYQVLVLPDGSVPVGGP